MLGGLIGVIKNTPLGPRQIGSSSESAVLISGFAGLPFLANNHPVVNVDDAQTFLICE